MENMGISKLTKEIKRLNPNVEVYYNVDSYPEIIIARCSDCTQLDIPTGYEFNGKNGITNKHNTTSGICESFDFMTEYEYLSMLA